MAKMNVNLKNSNTSEEILLNYDDAYLISQVDWGTVDVQQNSTKFYKQIGTSYISTAINARSVTISGFIIAATVETLQERKREMERIINPIEPVKMIVNDVYLEGYLTQNIKFGVTVYENNEKLCLFYLSFKCDYPLFRSATTIRTDMSVWIPLFHFDLAIPAEGIAIETKAREVYKNIENLGDVETPFTIRFTTNATVQNPTITNVNTGEYIKILVTMQAGDIIIVNTAPDANIQIQLIRNGVSTNIYNMRDRGSTLNLKLHIGDNLFRYSAETIAQEDVLEVSVFHDDNFWGCRWIA